MNVLVRNALLFNTRYGTRLMMRMLSRSIVDMMDGMGVCGLGCVVFMDLFEVLVEGVVATVVRTHRDMRGDTVYHDEDIDRAHKDRLTHEHVHNQGSRCNYDRRKGCTAMHKCMPMQHVNKNTSCTPTHKQPLSTILTKHVSILCTVLHITRICTLIPTDTTLTLTTLTDLHVYNDPTNFTACPYMLSPTPSLIVLKKYGTEYAITLNNAYLCSLERKVFENSSTCLWEIKQNAYGYFLKRDGLCFRGGCMMAECNDNDEDQSYMLVEKELCVAGDESTLEGQVKNKMMGRKISDGKDDGSTDDALKRMEEKYGHVGTKMKALIGALHKDKKKKEHRKKWGMKWKRPSWRGIKLPMC